MFGIAENDMYVLNVDSIWITNREALDGGIFLTTNGGASWTRKYYAGGTSNPERIYFANSKLGFASKSILLRTSDGGNTWDNLQPERGFTKINFIDSLIGYKVTMGAIMKTTNAGINWILQTLPSKNDTISSISINDISKLKKDDTLFAVGPRAFYTPINGKGLIFKTTNGGNTWGYQLPDTNSIKFKQYSFVDFLDNNTGWAYQIITGGIYTNIGGDTTIYVGIKNISSEIPVDFKLYQNYPNPFNPITRIRYDALKKSKIVITIYDITGKEIGELVNSEHLSGTYEVTFDANAAEFKGLASGIYFYTLTAGNFKQTLKMILTK